MRLLVREKERCDRMIYSSVRSCVKGNGPRFSGGNLYLRIGGGTGLRGADKSRQLSLAVVSQRFHGSTRVSCVSFPQSCHAPKSPPRSLTAENNCRDL